jgi:putative lipoic acid-binding regulatory protein
MGVNQPDFKSAVIHICQQLDPSFNLNQIEERNSKANNYLGLTVTIQDEIYRTLSTHPLVRVVL